MSAKKKKSVLRVGFDLDGVVLSNPIRIFRPFLSTGKKFRIIPRKDLEFYQPKTALERQMWFYLHKSSWRLAGGYDLLKNLANTGQIEAFVISARFSCLAKDSERWLKKFKKDQTFQEIYLNDQNEQPHFFKERMIRKLKLDYYMEDNFDVVRYLSRQDLKTEIWWLSNLLDWRLSYPYKFISLQKIMKKLQGILEKS